MDGLKEALSESFQIDIKKIKTIKDVKGSSYVGKVVTRNGEKFAVKSLFLDPSRQRFITEAERLLYERGVSLALPVKNRNGQLTFNHRGHPFVLYRWIDGKPLSISKEKYLLRLIKTMATFHYHSSNLPFPKGVRIYGHQNWLTEYEQRIHNMKKFLKKNKDSNHQIKRYISQNIPFFKETGKNALHLLKMSHYLTLKNAPYQEQTLVHGDFHQNNILVQGNKRVIIDFEDVRYDFPSKDILRLFSMYCRNRPFRIETFERMMKTYEKHHPLRMAIKEIVYIDLLFPHIFEHMIRKKRYKKMTLKEVKYFIKQEKKKAEYLSSKIFDQFSSF